MVAEMVGQLSSVLRRHAAAAMAGGLGIWLGLSLLTLALYVMAFAVPFFLGSHYTVPQLTWISMVGYRPELALAYTAVLLTLFGIYYLLYVALAANPEIPVWAVYVPPIAFVLALMAIYPADGWDLFVYISQGRLVGIHGLSPFLVSPQDAPQDALYAYSSWVSHVSIYGPVWLVISTIAAYFGGDNLLLTVLFFKLAPTVFLFASVVLVYLIVGSTKARYRHVAAFLLAWNPLVLFEVAGNGHNDIVMVFFILLCVYFLTRQQGLLSLPSLVVSTLAKYTSMVILPGLIVFAIRSRANLIKTPVALAGAVCLSLALGYLFIRPFGMGISLEALLGQGESFRSSIASVLFLSLRGSFAPQDATAIAKAVVGAAFVMSYLWLFVKYLREGSNELEGLLRFSSQGIFLLLLFLPRFLAWYAVWLLGIAVLIPVSAHARRAIILSLTAFLSHIVYYFVLGIYGDRINYFTIETLGSSLVFGPPLLYWLYVRSSHRRYLLAEKDRTIELQKDEIARLRGLALGDATKQTTASSPARHRRSGRRN